MTLIVAILKTNGQCSKMSRKLQREVCFYVNIFHQYKLCINNYHNDASTKTGNTPHISAYNKLYPLIKKKIKLKIKHLRFYEIQIKF